jgi:GNAT superfamily N-acetyltransferase
MKEKSNLETKENLSVTTEILTTDALVEIIYKGKNLPQDKRFLSEEEGGVFKYPPLEGISFYEKDIFFPILKVGDEIVGLSKLEKDPYKNKNLWILFISIDPKYQNKGYASRLAEEIFRYAKKEGYSLETSSYTEIGYEKLKSLFNKLAEEYSVKFFDKEKLG